MKVLIKHGWRGYLYSIIPADNRLQSTRAVVTVVFHLRWPRCAILDARFDFDAAVNAFGAGNLNWAELGSLPRSMEQAAEIELEDYES